MGGGAALSMALTVGVGIIAVAGFTLMARQHGQTIGRLDRILAQLQAVKVGLDLLIGQRYQDARHAVQTALQTLDTEEERGDFDKFQAPLAELRRNEKFYADQMTRLLASNMALAYSAVFVECASLFQVISQAKQRALILYVGEAAAEAEALADQQVYEPLRNRFLDRFWKPKEHLAEITSLTEEQDVTMRQFLPLLPRPEALDFLRVPGLTRDPVRLKALRQVAAPRAGSPTVGIIPVEMAPKGWKPAAA